MSEEEIVRGICNGGRSMDAAVRTLYDTTAQRMLRFFVHHGVSGDEAKDILQDSFIKIVRSAHSFGGQGAARSWIWQIARNCLTDHLRKQARLSANEIVVNDERWQAIAESAAAPTDCPAGQSAEDCVRIGLEAFAAQMPERALAITLQMEGQSMVEIGEHIGRTVAATKEYLSQCRKKIQPFIAHCTELLST